MPASRTLAAQQVVCFLSCVIVVAALATAAAQSPPDFYAGASHAPKSQSGWQRFATNVDQNAPFDEAMGGYTSRGTPVFKRIEACFPAEERNLFWEVDQLRGPDFELHSLIKVEPGKPITKEAREAIRGQNTWMLWAEGNEAFWGWLFEERSYGISDFLILIDSRRREHRFDDAGLVNQPGMMPQSDPAKRVLGLYLDQGDGDRVRMAQPPWGDVDADTGKAAAQPVPPPGHPADLFRPGDPVLYRETLRALATDGVDPTIYGYPSGVVGLRLFPNPDFFGDTEAARQARRYWKLRVLPCTHDGPEPKLRAQAPLCADEDSRKPKDPYYNDRSVTADPNLVRPFRVGMTCAFCHIGPHPMNPPVKPNEPEWANLSSLIGAQYWDGSRVFSNLKGPDSFLYQIIASWQPGTLDTSLVITDQINDPNTMNAVFEVNSRLGRATLNPAEAQSAANLKIQGIEKPPLYANARNTPRVLLDGSDSIGVLGALARVYLNVGAYSEQWRRLHNPIIGLRAQRPFEIATMETKSVYWRTTQEKRIPELGAFLTYANNNKETFTSAMKLAHMPNGKAVIDREASAATRGRAVFVENCAICHSSNQPEGFALSFSRDWAAQKVPAAGEPARFVLPMDFADWEAFKLSDAYREYVKRISQVAGTATPTSDPFFDKNYLSTDIRIPVTLVGTNSSRAVGTNAMRGQIWDNFSSDAYKSLPAVGPVHFYNPYSGKPADDWGNNDVYYPPAGGPGYYRPASLVSLWATAPFLHNNALGLYTHEPSVEGRLTAFDDAAGRLLSKTSRPLFKQDKDRRPGDLRANARLAGHDPGFIYRTTARSWIDFPENFIRVLLIGVMGEGLTSFLTYYLWLALGVGAIVLVCIGRQQDAGFVLLLVAILVGAALRVTRIDTIYPFLWWIVAGAVVAALLLWLAPKSRLVAQLFFALLASAFFLAGAYVDDWVDGRHGPLKIGPIPMGTPVNLVQSLNPQAPLGDLVDALSGLTRGLLRVQKEQLSDADGAALRAFEAEAGLPLLKVSKCPDFVLDRGHWFAEGLSKEQKDDLKAFLKTL